MNTIQRTSYIGAPLSHTAMFITKKVEHLLKNLESVEDCLVFTEDTIIIPQALNNRHHFIKSKNPQLDYAYFAQKLENKKFIEEKSLKYILADSGYYISETAHLGDDVYIEPGCLIGHYVKIGNKARILSGSIIKNACIGNDVLINEKALIGTNGFTMAIDEYGNKIRIPSLGYVRIGNHVEIGAHDNISRGSGGDTIIEDYVKLDALIHIGHDVHLQKNTEITAGSIIGGFVTVEENAYIGINASVRNRINLGTNAFIGMGSTVTKSVAPQNTVVGNPARILNK